MATLRDQDCLEDTGAHRRCYGTRTYSDGCSWPGPQSPLPVAARKAAAASNLQPSSLGTHCCVNPIVRRESSSTLTCSTARSGCLLSEWTVMLGLPTSESFDDLMAGSQQANQRWRCMRCAGATKRAASSTRPWWHNRANSLAAFSTATSAGLGSSQPECRISSAATPHSPTPPLLQEANDPPTFKSHTTFTLLWARCCLTSPEETRQTTIRHSARVMSIPTVEYRPGHDCLGPYKRGARSTRQGIARTRHRTQSLPRVGGRFGKQSIPD